MPAIADSNVVPHSDRLHHDGGRAPESARLLRARAAAVAGGIVAVFAATACHSSTVTEGTGPNAPYVDVNETVKVPLDSNGGVSGTIDQKTELSAAGEGKVTVAVPMSANGLEAKRGAPTPSVTSGVATIKLEIDGPKVYHYDSNFSGKLPLTVKPSYELNGNPISLSALTGRKGRKLKRKGATLTVTYKITNIATHRTTVSFDGFNGKKQTETVQAPVPILARLAVTLPKAATNIEAAGATSSVTRKGVKKTWVFRLIPPLGPLTQSFAYSMRLSKISVPQASILAQVIVADSVSSGAVARASAKEVGEAKADSLRAMVKVQADIASLDALQRKLSKRLASSGNSALGGVGASVQSQLSAIDDTGITDLTSRLRTSLTALSTSIARAGTNADDHSRTFARHRARTHTLATEVAALATIAGQVETTTETAANDAVGLVTLIEGLENDLAAMPLAVKLLAPEWYAKTKLDLDAALVSTKAISSLTNDIAKAAAKLNAAARAVGTDAQAVSANARDLDTSFKLNVLSKLQTDISNASTAVTVDSASLESRAYSLGSGVSRASAKIGQLVERARESLLAADKSAAAEARSAIATAKLGIDQSVIAAGRDLATANSDYARLLAVEIAGRKNILPGGNATGARSQSGYYHYTIAGT